MEKESYLEIKVPINNDDKWLKVLKNLIIAKLHFEIGADRGIQWLDK